ncbi:MAG: hypothetical protein IJE48_10175 [Clostridia bacterium]|nr:hypothetical protein [Clostridia bacterium]
MDIKLEKLTDLQLAKRMSDYIATLQSITVRAEYYSLGQCPEKERKELNADYVRVRDSIREDLNYLNYNKDKKGSRLLWDKYYPSVNEAAAWGLYADPEGRLDKEYFKSVAIAEEKLTKYYSFDYWQIIAEL